MNGATAEPCNYTISAPSSSSTITIGASQNFLCTLRKSRRSFNKPCIRRVVARAQVAGVQWDGDSWTRCYPVCVAALDIHGQPFRPTQV